MSHINDAFNSINEIFVQAARQSASLEINATRIRLLADIDLLRDRINTLEQSGLQINVRTNTESVFAERVAVLEERCVDLSHRCAALTALLGRIIRIDDLDEAVRLPNYAFTECTWNYIRDAAEDVADNRVNAHYNAYYHANDTDDLWSDVRQHVKDEIESSESSAVAIWNRIETRVDNAINGALENFEIPESAFEDFFSGFTFSLRPEKTED